MRSAKIFVYTLILLIVVFFFTFGRRVEAKPDYAKKEKTACTTCHIKLGKPELNDTGKCYEKSKYLAVCQKSNNAGAPSAGSG